MTKLRICKSIVGNVSWLFSYDFWKGVAHKDFPLKGIVMLILFTACADIIRMIFIPGYPNKTSR